MSKVWVEINYKGIGDVLQSKGVRDALNEYAGTVMGRLPDGYEMSERTTDRAVTTVYAATYKARKDCLKNNTLLKAGGV